MMALLGWIVRILLVAALVSLVLRFFLGRRRPSSSAPGARGGPRRPGMRLGGALVRDPHCGTYVPESSAIRVGSGESVQYFCSESCRAAYAAARSAS